jgi:putative endonuclease
MDYYTYVLKSEIDGRLYKGHTSDLTLRLRQHNTGKTKSTKGFMPWVLVYFESFKTIEEAVAREKFFKTGFGREYIKSKLDKQ